MQTYRLIPVLALAGLIGFVTGCEKKPETPQTPPAKAEEGAVQKQLGAAADAAKDTAAKAATAASQAASDATAQAQGILDSAKKLAGESKWPDVSQTLSKLQGLKLTADQEKMLADLKAQVQKALQDAASKQPALPGGLLGK